VIHLDSCFVFPKAHGHYLLDFHKQFNAQKEVSVW